MTVPIRLAIVGLGKIARDQHLPAIAATSKFALVATVDPYNSRTVGVPHFTSIINLAASDIVVDAVVLCTPPQARRAIAQFAIDQGWHVFLEKPPGATIAEVTALRDAAAEKKVSLFAGWHSRFAAGVKDARAWLLDRQINCVTITWCEDVRRWHPGQDWIFKPGGFGVFDPGINALSIATHILPRPFFVEDATMYVPANRSAPIAARVKFCDAAGVSITMDLDYLRQGEPRWDVSVETDLGNLTLERGGALFSVEEREANTSSKYVDNEYTCLYERFQAVVHSGVSDVDIAPLGLVSDVFLKAERMTVESFEW